MNIKRLFRNSRIAKVFVFAAAIIALTLGFIGLTATTTTQVNAQVGAREQSLSVFARQALVGVDRAKLARIQDAELRDASVRAFDAVKALADNTVKEREDGLGESAESALDALAAKIPGTGTFVDCKNNYDSCKNKCGQEGKKWCGCWWKKAGCHLKALNDHF